MATRARAVQLMQDAVQAARRAIPADPPGRDAQDELRFSGQWSRAVALALATDERLAGAARRTVHEPDRASDAATWDAEEILIGWYDAIPKRHRTLGGAAKEIAAWTGRARGLVMVRPAIGAPKILNVQRVRGEVMVADAFIGTVDGWHRLEFALRSVQTDAGRLAPNVDLLTLQTGRLVRHPGQRALATNSAPELAARHAVWEHVRHVNQGLVLHDPWRELPGNCQFVAVAADASLSGAPSSALWCESNADVSRNAALLEAFLDPDTLLGDPISVTADELAERMASVAWGTRGIVGKDQLFAHVVNCVNERGYAVFVDAGWQHVGGAPLLKRQLDEMITRSRHPYRKSILHRRGYVDRFRFEFNDTTQGFAWERQVAMRELGALARRYPGRRDVFRFVEWLDGVAIGRTSDLGRTTRAAAERWIQQEGDGARAVARFPTSNRPPAVLVNHRGHSAWISYEDGELWVEPRPFGLRGESVQLRTGRDLGR
ncbi:MAG: hypothetical protein ACOYNI_10470 [Acidimicrobiia bacterium]